MIVRAAVAALSRGTTGTRQKSGPVAPNALPGSTIIRATVSAPDQTGPSLARFCAIGIVGLGEAAVAFELGSRH